MPQRPLHAQRAAPCGISLSDVRCWTACSPCQRVAGESQTADVRAVSIPSYVHRHADTPTRPLPPPPLTACVCVALRGCLCAKRTPIRSADFLRSPIRWVASPPPDQSCPGLRRAWRRRPRRSPNPKPRHHQWRRPTRLRRCFRRITRRHCPAKTLVRANGFTSETSRRTTHTRAHAAAHPASPPRITLRATHSSLRPPPARAVPHSARSLHRTAALCSAEPRARQR